MALSQACVASGLGSLEDILPESQGAGEAACLLRGRGCGGRQVGGGHLNVFPW